MIKECSPVEYVWNQILLFLANNADRVYLINNISLCIDCQLYWMIIQFSTWCECYVSIYFLEIKPNHRYLSAKRKKIDLPSAICPSVMWNHIFDFYCEKKWKKKSNWFFSCKYDFCKKVIKLIASSESNRF